MKMPLSSSLLTRRQAIRATVVFGATALAARWAMREEKVLAQTQFEGPGLHLLAVGDFGSKNDAQRRVAARMASFARELKQPLEAVLALGDNFYGKMTPQRFERDFEKMYDSLALPCPFYACLGNHDYEPASYDGAPKLRKFEAQLDYARQHPESRWKMPAKWYARELPLDGQPLLKLIVLDSNVREGELTPQEKLAQLRFLEAELARGTSAPWLWLVWHHPPFTETIKRKDNPAVLRMAEQALRTHPFSICLAGHDHNLQHLRVEGFAPSFIVSGAGGADRYMVRKSRRGFTRETLGFNHFHITPTHLETQFIDEEGARVHAFRRYRDGREEIVT